MSTKEIEILVNGKLLRKQAVDANGYDITKILQQINKERDQGLIQAEDPMVVRVRPVKT